MLWSVFCLFSELQIQERPEDVEMQVVRADESSKDGNACKANDDVSSATRKYFCRSWDVLEGPIASKSMNAVHCLINNSHPPSGIRIVSDYFL